MKFGSDKVGRTVGGAAVIKGGLRKSEKTDIRWTLKGEDRVWRDDNERERRVCPKSRAFYRKAFKTNTDAFESGTQGALTTKISQNYHRRRCHQYGRSAGVYLVGRRAALAPHLPALINAPSRVLLASDSGPVDAPSSGYRISAKTAPFILRVFIVVT